VYTKGQPLNMWYYYFWFDRLILTLTICYRCSAQYNIQTGKPFFSLCSFLYAYTHVIYILFLICETYRVCHVQLHYIYIQRKFFPSVNLDVGHISYTDDIMLLWVFMYYGYNISIFIFTRASYFYSAAKFSVPISDIS